MGADTHIFDIQEDVDIGRKTIENANGDNHIESLRDLPCMPKKALNLVAAFSGRDCASCPQDICVDRACNGDLCMEYGEDGDVADSEEGSVPTSPTQNCSGTCVSMYSSQAVKLPAIPAANVLSSTPPAMRTSTGVPSLPPI